MRRGETGWVWTARPACGAAEAGAVCWGSEVVPSCFLRLICLGGESDPIGEVTASSVTGEDANGVIQRRHRRIGWAWPVIIFYFIFGNTSMGCFNCLSAFPVNLVPFFLNVGVLYLGVGGGKYCSRKARRYGARDLHFFNLAMLFRHNIILEATS